MHTAVDDVKQLSYFHKGPLKQTSKNVAYTTFNDWKLLTDAAT